jgi:branched-chain amino acid transport system permease protein
MRAAPLRSILPWAAGFLILLALILTVPLNGYVTNLLMQAFTYAIGVLGMTVVLGLAGQINIAQAAFFGLGAYGLALGTVVLHLPFSVAAIGGILIASLFGIVLGAATLKLSGHYLAMVTISFQEILTLVLTNWVSVSRGPDGIPNIPRPSVGGLDLERSSHYLGLCLFFLTLTAFLVTTLKKARLGLAMQAVRDNPLAASVTGINVFRVKVIAFALSSILAGLGGALFAGAFRYISPDQFSFDDSVVFLTMGLLGGIDAAGGAMIGTILLILLPEWLRFLKEFYLAVYGLAVILIMIFMPRGIWGFIADRLPRPKAPALPPGVTLHLSGNRQQAGAVAAASSPLLEVKALSKHFGGLRAVDGVDFAVAPGTIHALIGPNGSGKTTTLNLLSGLYRPTAGHILLAGEEITALSPHERALRGMGRTFQNIRLFHSLTAYDNVFIGAFPQGGASVAALRERALAALDFVGLAARADEIVASLPYGHQRLVEIARALAADPSLLLLDEPGAGLNLTEKQNLMALLRRLRSLGLTILLIEHDMDLVARISDHITVLNFGRRIADGPPREVLRHPDVIAAYLGEAPAHEAA